MELVKGKGKREPSRGFTSDRDTSNRQPNADRPSRLCFQQWCASPVHRRVLMGCRRTQSGPESKSVLESDL